VHFPQLPRYVRPSHQGVAQPNPKDSPYRFSGVTALYMLQIPHKSRIGILVDWNLQNSTILEVQNWKFAWNLQNSTYSWKFNKNDIRSNLAI